MSNHPMLHLKWEIVIIHLFAAIEGLEDNFNMNQNRHVVKYKQLCANVQHNCVNLQTHSFNTVELFSLHFVVTDVAQSQI